MAFYEKYSPVLSNLLAMFVPNYDEASYQDIISTGRPKIFNFDYPIWDNAYKPVLETKIIKHYYDREICTETPDLFKFYLDCRMNEIMPFYIQLYNSTLLTFDPLINHDEKETYTKTGTQDRSIKNDIDSDGSINRSTTTENTSNSTNDYKGDELFSDTPQAALADLNYATNLTKSSQSTSFKQNDNITDDSDETSRSSTSSTGVENINTTDDYIRSKTGNIGGNYSEMLLKFRETLINIDLMIIDELKDLFMSIY